jgi:sugar (pentulose or hexulose) kinase
MRIATVDTALDETAPGATRLMASGGALVHSAAWCQVMADAIGRPVSTLGVDEASSRGAALVALARAGAPRPRKMAVRRTFRPRPEAHAAHRRAYRRVETLYGALIEGRLLDE